MLGGGRVERVKQEENIIDIFENDIEYYLNEFKDQQEIEDFKQVGQSVWNGALRYVYNNVFKNNKQSLKQHNNIVNNNNIMDSTYNMYNYDLLDNILDIYIYYCQINNKEISIIGYSILTGIDQENIYNWANDDKKLSSKGFKIYKKLSQMREESLSNKLADGKQNPVGVIAMLNRHYGWSSPYTSDANKNRSSLTAAELPKLNGDNVAKLPYNSQENG